MYAPPQPLRIGLVGCGRICQIAHLPSFLALRALVRVVAAADPDQYNRDAVGATVGLGSTALFDDHRRMLDRGGLDAIVIATPHAVHTRQLIDAAEAGVDAVCEKPLVCEAAELREVQEGFRRAERRCAVVHNYLFTAGMIAATAGLAEDSPYACQAHACFRKAFPAAQEDWRFKAGSGGGALNDTCYHEIYLVEALMGSPVSLVQGQVRSALFSRSADDLVQLLFQHANGATSGLLVGWCLPSRSPQHYIEVHTACQSWCVSGRGKAAERYDVANGYWTDPVPATARPRHEESGHRDFFEATFRALAAGAPLPVGLDAAVRQTAILEGARRASASRSAVCISEI